jgi:hypothetical protein
MTTELTSLQACADVLRAVSLLARGRHLHLRLAASDPVPAGFVRGVPAIDLWTSTGCAIPSAVEQELERWVDGGVEFAIVDIASFGVERLIETIYFPLLVRFSYCLGASDHPMNLLTLRRLVTPDVLLTVAVEGGVEVAATLFQPSARTPCEPGYPAADLVEGGLDIAASATRDPAVADAFFHASLQMLEASGFGAVRLRRSPWATQRTAAGWCADLARADRIAWEERTPADYFAWQPAALAQGEGILCFDLEGEWLRPRLMGSAHEALVFAERRASDLLRPPAIENRTARAG